VAGCCEHGNELLDSKNKRGIFFIISGNSSFSKRIVLHGVRIIYEHIASAE
jgi:hypothetical protein